jgi:hypothetical protein
MTRMTLYVHRRMAPHAVSVVIDVLAPLICSEGHHPAMAFVDPLKHNL